VIPTSSNLTRKDYLRRLLCPLWLRPESALWYAHEAFLARQYLGRSLRQPSLELGCMEGTSTFILLGGEFGLDFDVYSEVRWDRQSKSWKSLADDYYNMSKESVGGKIDAKILPAERFSVGLSWKQAHLDKARRLGIHERLVQHDPSQPLTLFADRSFATVWAPNLYWVEHLPGAIRELRRVLRPDGSLVTVLPDTAALDHMLYRFQDRVDREWLKDLDRGRYSNISRHARDLAAWDQLFRECRLTIARHDRFLPTAVFQVNDVGLRPMFPVFMDIYEVLRERASEEWRRIKEHWIETAFHFLAPLCDMDWMDRLEMAKVWHIFELKPATDRRNHTEATH
jgi:SAM-dependent methyltransferase